MARFRAMVVMAAVTATLLAGFTNGPTSPTASPEPEEPTAPSVPVAIPDTPAGRATEWVLGRLDAGSGPSAAEAREQFAAVFLAEIAAEDVAGVFDQIRALGPFDVTGYAEGPVEGGVTAQTEVTGRAEAGFLLLVSVDAEGLIQGLFLRAAPELPAIAGYDDVVDALGDAGDEGSYLLARVEDDGGCEPVASFEPDELRPVGSVFKLYVLAAVVHAVSEGTLGWEDTLTLTDEVKSLPTGTLQDEPAGTQVTVREAAALMISISDNTATDLLIDAVGRPAVEAAVSRLGHDEPEVLRPFLTTRELFQLAFAGGGRRSEWTSETGSDPLTADPAASERQLALAQGLPGGAIAYDPELLGSPAWPIGLDWFATASDVCRAHAALAELAQSEAGAPVGEILSRNPGIEDRAGMDYVAFKGGSAPGEIAGSWYVEAGGDRFVLVVQVASREGTVPGGAWLVSVAEQTLALALG